MGFVKFFSRLAPRPCRELGANRGKTMVEQSKEITELLERCRLHLEAMRQNPETPEFIRLTVMVDFRRLLEITDRASTPSELPR